MVAIRFFVERIIEVGIQITYIAPKRQFSNIEVMRLAVRLALMQSTVFRKDTPNALAAVSALFGRLANEKCFDKTHRTKRALVVQPSKIFVWDA